MSRHKASADSQFVSPLQYRTALAAQHGEAILANQGPRDGRPALRAIKHTRLVLFRLLLVVHLSIIATGCLRIQTAEPAIGEAFVAPATLEVREEIAPRAKVAARLTHGSRVEILARQHRFAKVRVPYGGAAGWTDGRQLLTAKGMALFRAEGARAAKLPPQGTATAAETVNVHISPNRASPSFHRLAEGDPVRIAARVIRGRGPYAPPDTAAAPVAPQPGEPRDEWCIVCMPDDRCGWVLAALLMIDLPDEIIQLAEGHRILSFFTIATPRDARGREHPAYLWTTSAVLSENFDAFRVFAWNPARERYESAHHEKNLRGYPPVIVEGHRITLIYAAPERGQAGIERHTFELRGRKLAHQISEPFQPPSAVLALEPLSPLPDGQAAPASWWERWRHWSIFSRSR
ncbi:MAG: hypothetical protein IT162_02440 [Bryobacterales bacterium]|nr:hypothetical protein [Bryobacterales bacterium]